eukprot:1277638-Amphidinium_carterae.1
MWYPLLVLTHPPCFGGLGIGLALSGVEGWPLLAFVSTSYLCSLHAFAAQAAFRAHFGSSGPKALSPF